MGVCSIFRVYLQSWGGFGDTMQAAALSLSDFQPVIHGEGRLDLAAIGERYGDNARKNLGAADRAEAEVQKSMSSLAYACIDEVLQPQCLHALAASEHWKDEAREFLIEQAGTVAHHHNDVPTQMHLALGGIEDGKLSMTWVTARHCEQSLVLWGDNASSLVHEAPATTQTYTVPDHWWQPQQQKWIHTAAISGLSGYQSFAYVVGDRSTPGCSMLLEPMLARAPPPRGELPLRTALMADVGSIELLGFAVWQSIARSIADPARDVDLIVHAGDVSYAGTDHAIPLLNISRTDEWEPLWDLYGHAHVNVTRRRPYMVGIGNHEAWYNWTAVRHRYPMLDGGLSAASAALAQPPFWFSYESGGVHWTMLSSEHPYEPSTPQHAFASAALSSVNRSRTPWSVVAFHRPMYCSDAAEYAASSPGGRLQRNLEALLLKSKVDLVVSGHLHAYERVHPNVAGNVTSMPSALPPCGEPAYMQPPGPVYLTVGHGGAVQVETWVTPAPRWSARRMSQGCDFTAAAGGAVSRVCGKPWRYSDTFGWVRAEFMNATHARLNTEMLSGKLGDAFWIVRDVAVEA